MPYHYVYRIDSGKFFYIGARTSWVSPEEDTSYMGSGVWCLFYRRDKRVNDGPRVKTIVSVHPTMAEARKHEAQMIVANQSPNCMNRKLNKMHVPIRSNVWCWA